MIDTQNETLIGFGQAPKIIPGRPHLSQVYRWAQRGLRGVRLEWCQVGGKRFTSREAIARFIGAMTAAAGGEPAPRPTAKNRIRQRQEAERELQAAGFVVG